MNTNSGKKLRLLVIAAMFAAMTTALTFFVKIPTPGGGYIHPGDSIIYLAACFLPTPYALASAGIGGALSDLFGGYSHYIIPTFIIKALITLPFSSKTKTLLTKRNALMVLPAGIITVVGYYLTKVILLAANGATTALGFLGSIADITVWGSALLKSVPENLLQAVGSAIIFIAIAFALDKSNLKSRLTCSI